MQEKNASGESKIQVNPIMTKASQELNPYVGLPASAYWKSAVAEHSPLAIRDIYTPRFPITQDMIIAAAGSCFAQHIGNQFKERGYKFLDVEPPPPILAETMWKRFGYGLYSGRYGNVYSIRQLLQMFKRAYGQFSPQENAWEGHGRFYDPFRPSIEPNGFASETELRKDVAYHLECVRRILAQVDVFVFTFGLTEAWVGIEDGAVYPTCPGTVAGTFDAQRYQFHNFSFSEIVADTEEFMAFAQKINPTIKFLFTVSPVPLTATATGEHVLQASVYSKSVLRAACGDLYSRHINVDYFPSFELVSAHPFRAMFFDPNLRTVTHKGVAHVMDIFFASQLETVVEGEPPAIGNYLVDDSNDVVCDEEILRVFGP